MNIWEWVNLSAWALVGFMLFVMLRDFIHVERALKKEAEKEATPNV